MIHGCNVLQNNLLTCKCNNMHNDNAMFQHANIDCEQRKKSYRLYKKSKATKPYKFISNFSQ